MKRRHARALLRGVLARPALAQSRSETRAVGDSAKRSVALPAKIERVFVAGPPASVLAYVLAPDAMVGWIRQPSPAEKEFLAAPARDLRETGRLTGRGDTLSLERLFAAKPDLVLDFGSTTWTMSRWPTGRRAPDPGQGRRGPARRPSDRGAVAVGEGARHRLRPAGPRSS